MKLVEDLELGRIADTRLAEHQHQIDQIVAAALTRWGHVSRKLLLLSERTDHITAIAGAMEAWCPGRARCSNAWGSGGCGAIGRIRHQRRRGVLPGRTLSIGKAKTADS